MNKFARSLFIIYKTRVCVHTHKSKKTKDLIFLAAYFCHGSWEEKGTWYTIVSQRNSEFPANLGQTFCFSMRLEGVRVSERGSRQKQQEQELWLSRPSRTCQRESKDEYTYRLSNQGIYKNIVIYLYRKKTDYLIINYFN